MGTIALCILLATTNKEDSASWVWPVSIVLPLAIAAVIYGMGTVRLYYRGTNTRALCPALFFFGGWLSLIVALDSPIHELSERHFWVHMTQHEILMLVSAPLLVLGRPVYVALWALPQRSRLAVSGLLRPGMVRSVWSAISAPFTAWLLSSLTLWIWHTPFLFDAALRSDFVHGLQHLSFLATSLLFWWTLVEINDRRLTHGGAILYLFITTLEMSLLSSLLTFSARVWFSPYIATDMTLQLALQDQQLGGLIMWVPAGALLLLITLVFFWRWLQYSDVRWEYARAALIDRGAEHP
jgi:putative membrane protein